MVRKAVIVGSGPVGCLTALALSKAGWSVAVYDARADIRLPENKSQSLQRSINLAISSRGIAALHAVDPLISKRFMKTVIPMRGRMIHTTNGAAESQLYDLNGQCINSIDRALLNEDMLNELTAASIEVHFDHKLVAADFNKKVLTFNKKTDGTTIGVPFDFCVGADGSYSTVRSQLMRVTRMDYQQEYIPHEYIELRVPARVDENGNEQFQLDPGHLHIWPRHSFMLIALPNQDKSFTSTLFAPTSEFSKLKSPDEFVSWFRLQFPDATEIIGEARLKQDFLHNPRSPLIHIKAHPYHYKDRVIILGDAAHAMVPFYGQGLNCGLEDVRVLDVLLRKNEVDPVHSISGGEIDGRLANALQEYTETRHDDLIAICDLAMANYEEMRHSVTTPLYRLRKMVDGLLSHGTRFIPFQTLISQLTSTTFSRAPSGWLALYTMVTFRPDISYAEVRRKAERQNRLLEVAVWSGLLATAYMSTVATLKWLKT